ncbi:hypothetical protein AYI70_g8716 [Smittium culicis]|uniref:Uncharacterized protein n=1 Tax=Smittium culicis TaxID=133412 RepID=A0A1R1XEM6_9FUNG|nr:hypothetical protein AYI70_g8716 [Smittium culicis]
MNYHPPPLNESASSAVKKADACLYGIQIAFAQSTRPIDHYVQRIIQDNLQANSEDPHILFFNTMRVHLADIAASLTQGRLDNLHKGLELPGILQQLIEPESKPLMDQEKLDALTASKKPEKRCIVRKPFRGRQQYGTQNSTGSKIAKMQITEAATTPDTFDEESAATPKEKSDGATTTDTSSKTAQEENGSLSTRSPDNRSCVTIDKESDRGSEDTRSRILQQSVRYTKEDQGTQTSLGSEDTESPCTGAELQYGVSLLNLPTDPQEGLHDVTGSRRCIYAHSNPRILQEVHPILLEWESIPVYSSSVRTFTESSHVYKDSSPGFDMSENTRNPNVCIFGRSIDPGRIEREMRIEYSQGSIQANGTWQGASNANCITPWTSHVSPTLGTEEYISVEEESIDIDGDIDRAGNTESTILGYSTAIMEWPVIPPRDTRDRSFYGCERLGMGNSCGIQILLRIMESIGGVDAHQRQRIIDNIILSSAQECYRLFSISLLRQYYHIGLRQEI